MYLLCLKCTTETETQCCKKKKRRDSMGPPPTPYPGPPPGMPSLQERETEFFAAQKKAQEEKKAAEKAAEEAKLQSMGPEARAAYRAQKAEAEQHAANKEKMLKKQLASGMYTGMRFRARGGRGGSRAGGRGGRAGVGGPPTPKATRRLGPPPGPSPGPPPGTPTSRGSHLGPAPGPSPGPPPGTTRSSPNISLDTTPSTRRMWVRAQLVRVYTAHRPEKLGSIDGLMRRFQGREDELFKIVWSTLGIFSEDPPTMAAFEAVYPAGTAGGAAAGAAVVPGPPAEPEPAPPRPPAFLLDRVRWARTPAALGLVFEELEVALAYGDKLCPHQQDLIEVCQPLMKKFKEKFGPDAAATAAGQQQQQQQQQQEAWPVHRYRRLMRAYQKAPPGAIAERGQIQAIDMEARRRRCGRWQKAYTLVRVNRALRTTSGGGSGGSGGRSEQQQQQQQQLLVDRPNVFLLDRLHGAQDPAALGAIFEELTRALHEGTHLCPHQLDVIQLCQPKMAVFKRRFGGGSDEVWPGMQYRELMQAYQAAAPRTVAAEGAILGIGEEARRRRCGRWRKAARAAAAEAADDPASTTTSPA